MSLLEHKIEWLSCPSYLYFLFFNSFLMYNILTAVSLPSIPLSPPASHLPSPTDPLLPRKESVLPRILTKTLHNKMPKKTGTNPHIKAQAIF